MKRAVIQILIAALFAVSTIANAVESDAEIVAKLEKMAGSYPSLVDAKGPVISPPTSFVREWYRRKVFVTNVAYDVLPPSPFLFPFFLPFFFFWGFGGDGGGGEIFLKSPPNPFHRFSYLPFTYLHTSLSPWGFLNSFHFKYL